MDKPQDNKYLMKNMSSRCPAFDCEIKKLCAQMHKLGMGKNLKWMAIVLFVRDLVNDFSIFTNDQKKAMQMRVLKEMGNRGVTGEHFQEIVAQLEEFILNNSTASDFETRLEAEKEAASSLLNTINEFLRDSVASERARGNLVDAYGRQTMEALDSGEDVRTLTPKLRGLLAEMLSHYQDEARHWQEKALLLEQSVSVDPLLAPLYNRNALEKHLCQALERTQREGTPLSMLLIDVDKFKTEVNDRYGHQVGDDVLRALAKIVDALASASESFAARYGGDELIVVCELPLDKAVFQAQAIRLAVQSYEFKPRVGDRLGDQVIKFTVSIGVAEYHSGWTAEQFLDAADQAMYQVKASGRNNVAGFCSIKSSSAV